MNDVYGIIYKTTNIINGKIYIGQTIYPLRKRMNEHINASKLDNPNYVISRAIKKHGEENFSWEIIDFANNREELDEKEIHYIKKYNSYIYSKGNNGYNMTLGGNGASGFKRSKQSNKKVSEYRIKNGLASGEKNPMFGKKHSEESVKMNAMNQPTIKPVIKLTSDGEFVEEYESIREASRITKSAECDIINCCNGKAKSVFGFIWLYKSEYNEGNVSAKVEELKNKPKPIGVVCLTKNGEFVSEANSIKEMARNMNLDASTIGKCCKPNTINKTHKGYRFMTKDEYYRGDEVCQHN